eukprot:SAG11_NODE_1704_length_4417_cov_1.891616_1_plen_76_part_00
MRRIQAHRDGGGEPFARREHELKGLPLAPAGTQHDLGRGAGRCGGLLVGSGEDLGHRVRDADVQPDTGGHGQRPV